ncbi:MAG TPA: HlyD family efflux transporter periplasmic adaptor subunit [Steroidobacteraceae bacterium]|nr:HlyD family efflux transporter periplasmic adaptor subunit [Steroidobacteraceae bacterium]
MIGAVALLGSVGMAPPSVERERLWIERVQRGEMLRQVRAQGILAPREIRWVTAATAANVSRILVRPGARVSADTVLMELSNPELRSQLDAARAAVAAAKAGNAAHAMTEESQLLDLEATEAQISAANELAAAKLQAGEKLKKFGSIAELTMREYELNAQQQRTLLSLQKERVAKFRETQRAQLEADRAGLAQLEDTLTLRQQQVDALGVRAATDGVVQSIPVQEGAQVIAGANLARIARPGALRAELNVSETEANDIQVGQKVEIDTRVGLVAGRVERIDPAVVHNTVEVDVELLGTPPGGARADLSVDGTIEIDRLPNVLYMPRPVAAREGATLRLFRVDANGRYARRVTVRLGRTSSMNVEILQGLSPDDRVVLSDMTAYERNDIIRLD